MSPAVSSSVFANRLGLFFRVMFTSCISPSTIARSALCMAANHALGESRSVANHLLHVVALALAKRTETPSASWSVGDHTRCACRAAPAWADRVHVPARAGRAHENTSSPMRRSSGDREKIAFTLRGRGHLAFFDKEDLPAGSSYDEQIVRGSRPRTWSSSSSAGSRDGGRYTLTELMFAPRNGGRPKDACCR